MIDQKLNLGVDMDGVICNLWDPFRREIFIRTGIYIPQNIPEYDVEKCSKVTRSQAEDIFKKGGTMYQSLPEVPGAKNALLSLKKRYKIHIITHRNFYRGIQKDTLRWLRMHEIPYNKITFTGSDKTQQVLDAGCEYMIEDRGKTAVMLAKKGQKVVLLDYSYNKNFKHKLITRAKNWNEIVGVLEPNK